MVVVDSIDYLRGMKGKDSVLIILEKVLAGVMKPRRNAIDLDTTIESGVYGINKEITKNTPVAYGSLIVFFTGSNTALGGNPIVQVAVNETASIIKIRSSWLGQWASWKSITVA